MKLKYYHTTGTKYKVGDVIGGPGIRVFLHTSPVSHGTIQEIVDAGYGSWKEYVAAKDIIDAEYWKIRLEWNDNPVGEKPVYPKIVNPKPVELVVYEMKPYNKPIFGGSNDEYIAYDDFVEVIRVVGGAKGILHNFRRKFGKTEKAYHFGGRSRRPKGYNKLRINSNYTNEY
jgi:hypothetical protein